MADFCIQKPEVIISSPCIERDISHRHLVCNKFRSS